jgi:hypothetical protein
MNPQMTQIPQIDAGQSSSDEASFLPLAMSNCKSLESWLRPLRNLRILIFVD